MNIFTNKSDDFKFNKSLNKLILLLFISSLILIPFDDLPYISALGGLGKRASIYPFILMIPIVFFIFLKCKKVFYINCLENNLMLSFYSICLLSIIINFSAISHSLFKGQTGIKRAIVQVASITLLVFAMYCIQFIINRNNISIYQVRKYICLSFIPVAIVATIQLLNLLQIIDLKSIIENISTIVNASLRGESYNGRIRGVSAEASYLGMYCAFLFPWFFSYIITEKNKLKKVLYSIICVLIVAIVVGTKSRTAVLLMLIDIIVIFGLVLLFFKNFRSKLLSFSILVIMTSFLFSFSSIMESIINRPGAVENKPSNTVNNYEVGQLISSISNPEIDSNLARSSMQKAAFNIGLDHPFIGVGLGQFGFYSSDYIQDDALRSYEVKVWTDNNNTVWPPVHSLYHRIFAESGLLGLIIYFAFAITLCLKLFIKIVKDRNSTHNLLGIILLASYGSILIGGLTLDQFVIPQFWITSAIVILYNNNKISFNLK